jgi:hypothetical protein
MKDIQKEMYEFFNISSKNSYVQLELKFSKNLCEYILTKEYEYNILKINIFLWRIKPCRIEEDTRLMRLNL